MSEFYTDNSEDVDIDKLNKTLIEKSFEDRKFNVKDEKILTEEEYKINESKFLLPELDRKINDFETENEYIPKKTDPYKRILELKAELIENKSLIDSMINKFNDTSILEMKIIKKKKKTKKIKKKKKMKIMKNYIHYMINMID